MTFSEKRLDSSKKRLILKLILLVLLLIPTTVIAEPSHEGQFSVYYFADHPIEPERPKVVELPDPILSNCYAYVKMVYPSLPPMATILSNLEATGEVAVFYYPNSNLYHFAVVESVEPFIVTDTNYGSATKKTRQESGRNLIGFYSLE